MLLLHKHLYGSSERPKRMNDPTNLPLLTAYRALVRNLPETTVVMFDTTLQILLAEGSDLPVLGFSRDRIVGHTLTAALPEDNAALYVPHCYAALEGRRTTIEETFGDGVSIYQIQFSPARSEDNTILAGIIVCRNITGQRTAEDKLRDSESRNRALIRALPDTQLLLDKNGMILDVFQTSSVPQLMSSKPLIPGTSVRDLDVPQVVVRTIFELIEKAHTNEQLETAEVNLSTEAGAQDYAELRCVPLAGGRVLLVVRDVNELRKAEHALEAQLQEMRLLHTRVVELEQLKTDMLRLGAHDLRNPLMVIMNYARYLIEDLSAIEGSGQMLQYVNDILEAAERMRNISRDILDAERIEHMLGTTALETLDFVAALQEAAEGLRPNAALKNHTLTVLIPPNPLYGHGDAPMLREAAGNLISNAIKYTPDGGHIEVVIRNSDAMAEFLVTDNGYGIPPETLDSLFKPLTRAGTKEARHEAGTGFGLFLVKRIIDRHKGEVFVESRVGQGSTFGFRLPLQQQD